MGGKAFSNMGISVDRMDSGLYKWASDYLLAGSKYNGITANIPKHIAEKECHGDIDICVQVDDFLSLGTWLSNLNVEHKLRNGNVISLAIRLPYTEYGTPLIQVDLIKTAKSWHNFAIQYFSYNDSGNLYGRIAHRLGFKLGFDGLTYVLRENTHVIAEIPVTHDWDTALRLLAYNPVHYANGFKTYELLFDTVAKCPWFSKQIFLLENRNNVSRTRDAKRKTYQMFLEWLGTNCSLPDFPWTDENKLDIRAKFLECVKAQFPEFRKEYEQATLLAERRRRVKQLMNGDIMSQLSGYTGSELGKLMHGIKQMFPNQDSYDAFVLSVGAAAPKVLYERWQTFTYKPCEN